jgi:two-component system sensor histidine kinase KdpD
MTTPAPDLPTLLSTLSHDLRTPLATIYGFARTLERQVPMDARGERFVTLILEAATDMDRRLDQISTVGRVLTGRHPLAPRPVPADEVVAAAQAALPPRSDARAVRAVRGGPEGGALLLTDPDAAGRAVALLADAALRLDVATPEATVAAAAGGLRLAPYSGDVRKIVLEGGRDLALATAHVLLGALDGSLDPDGPDGVLVRLPLP